LRKILLIAVALCAVGASATAYAATQINTYTGTVSLTSKAPGTAKKPVSIGFTQILTASGTQGNRTAVMDDIKTTLYGVKSNWASLPGCTATQINNAHNDTGCPKKAEVASGSITALLGERTNFAVGGAACDPLLDVWNAGKGKLAFFFVDTPSHACVSLQTGSTGAYPGTYGGQGKNLVINVLIPSFVSYPVSGLAGSLTSETLHYAKGTVKVKGKSVPLLAAVGCKHGKRPYSTAFTATLPPLNGAAAVTQSSTVSGSVACSK
jgi:hypothetical protein